MSLHIIHKVSNFDLLVKALLNETVCESQGMNFTLVIFAV